MFCQIPEMLSCKQNISSPNAAMEQPTIDHAEPPLVIHGKGDVELQTSIHCLQNAELEVVLAAEVTTQSLEVLNVESLIPTINLKSLSRQNYVRNQFT